jgi:hypothetical protein
LNKGNGRLVCGTSLEPLEYEFNRKRGRRQTREEGPTEETTSVTVGRCSHTGQYKTIYPDDIIRNKQYSLEEIQLVLGGRNDYSLASPRTKSYWKSWYRDLLETVVKSLCQAVGEIINKEAIFHALSSYLKELGDCWLRYVLDLFYAGNNNLCMFFDLVGATIGYECGELHETHRDGGAETAWKGCKSSPGG